MSQTVATAKRTHWGTAVLFGCCPAISTILSRNQILGRGKSLILAYSVVIILCYWIGPRPPVSFRRYLYGMGAFMSSAVLALWLMPLELSKRMPMSIAVALPIFVIVTSSYWAHPLLVHSNSIKRPRLGCWILGSLAISIFMGWISRNEVIPLAGFE
jgi:hypothetical protein